ncbi:hypothetical protein C5167_030003 [Papaver somniferum]|nr:hypothetical protein C5167_030003 [Papaver somniferum]
MLFDNGWCFQFSRELDPTERIDLLELKFDVRYVILSHGEDDTLEGYCSAKAIYGKLSYCDLDWDCKKIISNKFVPPHVLFLFWAALHDSIPTRSMLEHRRAVIQSNLCLFYNAEMEILEHLFIHCSWANDLWKYFISAARVRRLF